MIVCYKVFHLNFANSMVVVGKDKLLPLLTVIFLILCYFISQILIVLKLNVIEPMLVRNGLQMQDCPLFDIRCVCLLRV